MVNDSMNAAQLGAIGFGQLVARAISLEPQRRGQLVEALQTALGSKSSATGSGQRTVNLRTLHKIAKQFA